MKEGGRREGASGKRRVSACSSSIRQKTRKVPESGARSVGINVSIAPFRHSQGSIPEGGQVCTALETQGPDGTFHRRGLWLDSVLHSAKTLELVR